MQKARTWYELNSVCFNLNKTTLEAMSHCRGRRKGFPSPQPTIHPFTAFLLITIPLPQFIHPCSIWCMFTGSSKCSYNCDFSSGPHKPLLLELGVSRTSPVPVLEVGRLGTGCNCMQNALGCAGCCIALGRAAVLEIHFPSVTIYKTVRFVLFAKGA